MDPNETLRQLLDLAAEIQENPDSTEDADDLAGHVLNLHLWLIKGGFLPDRWEIARKR